MPPGLADPPARSPQDLFDFLLDHSVPIDVWLVRFRIDVVTDVHTAMLSLAAARANWLKAHTLASVRITDEALSRGAASDGVDEDC